MVRIRVKYPRVAVMMAVAVAALIPACRSEREPAPVRLQGYAQGTTYHVVLPEQAHQEPSALQREIDARLAGIDRQFSNWRDDSVVERFNAERSTRPVGVDESLVELVEAARVVHRASRGCFDPTVRPVSRLWGFETGEYRVPDAAEIERALGATGLDGIEVAGPGVLRKAHPGLTLDLAGIAQGASVSRIAALLEARGIADYSVELGGELQVRGARPGGKPWRVAIHDPVRAESSADRQSVLAVLHFAGETPLFVATSGTYRKHFVADGTRHSHVIDPRTGRPVRHDTVSVTVAVLDESNQAGALADAWSTALLCLGADGGLEVANEHDIAALFISEAGSRWATAAWRERIEPLMEP